VTRAWLLLCLCWATPTQAQTPTLPLVVFTVGQVGDVVTTRIALSRPGFVEANPALAWVAESTPRLVLAKAATTTLTIWAVRRLSRDHPRAAKVVAWVVATVAVGVAAHNGRQIWGRR
jgi:uncharacterized membrane protein